LQPGLRSALAKEAYSDFVISHAFRPLLVIRAKRGDCVNSLGAEIFAMLKKFPGAEIKVEHNLSHLI
jgi:methyltransferase-like protein